MLRRRTFATSSLTTVPLLIIGALPRSIVQLFADFDHFAEIGRFRLDDDSVRSRSSSSFDLTAWPASKRISAS